MSDLFEDPAGEPAGNAPEFTVSELSGAVKRIIEGEFGHVRVRGEVGRVSRPRSGHVYLDLKDDRAVIAGVMWKGVASRLATQPEEGMEVIAIGRMTTFPGQSKYQIVIEDIRPAGLGALMAMLEKRKAALSAEGLFDPARKQPLPFLPEVIGVVTSPSGAVIRDILHRLRERFPRKVLIWPVAVQGEKCAPEVTRAIEGFNALSPGGSLPRPDLLIVARGGGSVEDLWGFNEEMVVRAAAASRIPLISAVGHETDTTLIDFASDKRAPTPTAAAELAVPVRLELSAWTEDQGARLTRALGLSVTQRRQRLADLSRALPRPDTLLDAPRQRLDILSDKLPQALITGIQHRRLALSDAAGSLRPAALRRLIAGQADTLSRLSARLAPALGRNTRQRRAELDHRTTRLQPRRLQADHAAAMREFQRLSDRLSAAATAQLSDWRRRIETADRLRETLGYRATLERGYAVVRSGPEVITSKTAAEAAGALEIEFADGRFSIGGAAPKPARKSKPEPPPDQGSLF
ncbi:exodeoxyribonuclease VII large subunit [Marinibacterium profundimaris]|uniref:Exodeoxyribonuclease 7 large subunit n=2 Tax=Marinibacterium profundimaris TaxID=1679460 RepID=A0A225NGG3_9RHOB|nr:exodeoxyribonuclease VII large subunit [Marinibacterium profundimaris]